MPQSPTLLAWFSLSDFYLFRVVKEEFEQIQVADEDQFLNICMWF
jgi:hypothetical protein